MTMWVYSESIGDDCNFRNKSPGVRNNSWVSLLVAESSRTWYPTRDPTFAPRHCSSATLSAMDMAEIRRAVGVRDSDAMQETARVS